MFGWVLNTALGNTVKKKKKPHLKQYFCSYVKLVSLLLSFCANEKNVLQRERKDWAFEFYLLTGEPSQFIISAD